ncbi:hypothetical protein Tco_1309899 [Tanacetum coccineum]
MFHVSNLKKCLVDENLVIPLEEIQLDDKLHFIEEPVEIMDREVKRLKQSRIPIVKILVPLRVNLGEVVSSEKTSLCDQEDASKQGRKINNIDANAEINLVDESQGRRDDHLMFDTCVFNDEEVFTGQDMAEKEVSTADPVTTAGEVVTTTNVEVSTVSPTAATITTVELTLAQTLAELKSAERTTQSTKYSTSTDHIQEKGLKLSIQQLFGPQKKKILTAIEQGKKNKPPTKAQQRSIMTTYLKNMAGWKPKDLKNKSFANVQELLEKALKTVNTFVDMDTELVEGSETRKEESSKRAGDELEQENAKKQKVDDDQETTELQSMIEVIHDKEEVAVDAIPLAIKPPSIVDWKIIKEGKIGYYQIIRTDGNSKRLINDSDA